MCRKRHLHRNYLMYLKEKRLNDTLICIYKDLKMFKVTFLTFKLNALGLMGEGGGGGGGGAVSSSEVNFYLLSLPPFSPLLTTT